MSTVPLATVACPTLADAVDESLASVLAGREEPCLWCGSAHVTVTRADIWSGEVAVHCLSCGSRLSGVVPRYLREVQR
jgi:transcription elongation factor Elf1